MTTWRLGAFAGLILVAAGWATWALAPHSSNEDDGQPSPSPEFQAATPVPLDTLTALAGVVERIIECKTVGTDRSGGVDPAAIPARAPNPTCTGVIYVWSPAMPLSRLGIQNIAAATTELGVPLALVDGMSLEDQAWNGGRGAGPESDGSDSDSVRSDGTGSGSPTSDLQHENNAEVRSLISPPVSRFIDEMVAAGATIHYPAILVHRDAVIVGGAIVGYKTVGAYAEMIEARLAASLVEADERARTVAGDQPSPPPLYLGPDLEVASHVDVPIPGRPGAYFRSIPGTLMLAYESEGKNRVVDVTDSGNYLAPGYIDPIPSPDGLYFMTPRRGRGGLAFHDVAWTNDPGRDLSRMGTWEPEPLFVDGEMQDQYPSIGILETDGSTANYRVLTSWWDGIRYRDYRIQPRDAATSARVRPRGAPVVACEAFQLSIPIMSRDGQEVAARDEATATTKIFRILEGGRCREVLDLGMQTGKVAFDPTGRFVAFAVPRGAIRDGNGIVGLTGRSADRLTGIFVLDREKLSITRVPGSEEAHRLVFPDFVSEDTVVFLIRRDGDQGRSNRFRLVCCVK